MAHPDVTEKINNKQYNSVKFKIMRPSDFEFRQVAFVMTPTYLRSDFYHMVQFIYIFMDLSLYAPTILTVLLAKSEEDPIIVKVRLILISELFQSLLLENFVFKKL